MLPLKIDSPARRLPPVTIAIIIICSVIYFNQAALFSSPGLVPLDIVHSFLHPGTGLPAALVGLMTAFFMHAGLLHLAGNMWYLWIFGSALENIVSSGRFLLAYLSFGIISMAVQIADNPISSVPIVGASGAIAGVMGMYLVLQPFSKMLLWFPPIFFFRQPSSIFLLFWFWLQWKSSATPDQHENLVAWWAHIGGFAGGALCGLYMRFTGKAPVIRFRRNTKH